MRILTKRTTIVHKRSSASNDTINIGDTDSAGPSTMPYSAVIRLPSTGARERKTVIESVPAKSEQEEQRITKTKKRKKIPN